MPEERRGKLAVPDCFSGYYSQPATVRSSVCLGCFAKKRCVEAADAQRAGNPMPGNTTLYAPQSAPRADPRVAQWETMWNEIVQALRNNPSTGEVAEWMDGIKRQRFG